MKHINESIIGRRGSQTLSSIYQLEKTYEYKYKILYRVLYLNEKEYDRYIEDIMILPGLYQAQQYLEDIHKNGGDVIIWAEENNRFSPAVRFFLQSTKLMYGIDHIWRLPVKSIPPSGLRPKEDYNTFKITKKNR